MKTVTLTPEEVTRIERLVLINRQREAGHLAGGKQLLAEGAYPDKDLAAVHRSFARTEKSVALQDGILAKLADETPSEAIEVLRAFLHVEQSFAKFGKGRVSEEWIKRAEALIAG